MMPNVQQRQSMHLFGVFDGCGKFGREMANYLKHALPYQIEQRFPGEGLESYQTI